MPRGVRGAGETRGLACPRCGDDRWVRAGNAWRCRPCATRQSVAWATRTHRRDPARALLHSAQSRSGRFGRVCTITRDDIAAVWPPDNRCPVFGTLFVQSPGRSPHPDAPSLDRIDSSRGYEPGNIAVISHRANSLKRDATPDELTRVAQWMESLSLRA